MATRPSLDETMMAIAQVLSRRATCVKRQVGCVLVNDYGFILSTGYNGVPAGFPHCIDVPCPGADSKAGSDTCMGVHAEINALIRCKEPSNIAVCYTTVLPCTPCMKALMNTGCHTIVYAQPHDMEHYVRDMWFRTGRTIRQLASPILTDKKIVDIRTRPSDVA